VGGVTHPNFAVSSRLNGDMVSLMVFAPRDPAFIPPAFAASVYVKAGILR
jgi:hypothetical protein